MRSCHTATFSLLTAVVAWLPLSSCGALLVRHTTLYTYAVSSREGCEGVYTPLPVTTQSQQAS